MEASDKERTSKANNKDTATTFYDGDLFNPLFPLHPFSTP